MKKYLILFSGLLVLLGVTGCGGPREITRAVDQYFTASESRVPWRVLRLEHMPRVTRAGQDAPKVAMWIPFDDGLIQYYLSRAKECDARCRQSASKIPQMYANVMDLADRVNVYFIISAPQEPDTNTWRTKTRAYFLHNMGRSVICGRDPAGNLDRFMRDGKYGLEIARLMRRDTSYVLASVRDPGKGEPDRSARKRFDAMLPPVDPACGVEDLPMLFGLVYQHGRRYFRCKGWYSCAEMHSRPVLVREDGKVHRGYMTPDQILAWVKKGKEK